jgi:hypothetical protein
MGLFAIVAYHPREGMEAKLREAIRDHTSRSWEPRAW